MGWDTRRAWSGELAAAEAVALQRFDALYGAGSDWKFAADAGPDWDVENWGASSAHHDTTTGFQGGEVRLNTTAPASEQTALRVPNFDGLWPSSGKLVLYAVGAFTFAMGFTPIISTRNTPGSQPLVYLSATASGNPRHQVYAANGTMLLDRTETPPWTPGAGQWVFYMMCVDLDNSTSQLAIVKRTGELFVSPLRSFTGTPNKACTADLSVFSLAPTASYWASGWATEAAVMHAPENFDFAAWADEVRGGVWARGADRATHAHLAVTDSAVTALADGTLTTGAEPSSWDVRPDVVPRQPLVSAPLAILSSDDGATWTAPTAPGDLPDSFSGLVRWEVPLAEGETFTGLDLIEPTPVPVVDPLPHVSMPQRGSATTTVTGTWTGTPSVHAIASEGLSVAVSGTSVSIGAGLAVGDMTVTVTVTDATGQTSTPVEIPVTVTVTAYDPPDTPIFPKSPILVHDASGEPDVVIIDATSAFLLREINGEQTLTFTIPAAHRHASALIAERTVTCADDLYVIRRLTTYRDNAGTAMIEAYCEARWYDLRTAGRVREREFSGAQAGATLTYVLDGTGWTVDAVTVTTRRTWTMENQTSLAALRTIADVYGGDLVFDNHTRTVSLLATFGRDQGVAFFHGAGLSQARRVEDTTQLLTRIEPRNAEGVGIEAVNGGIAWLEDFSYTSEVRHGVYNYASGTSPQTMLAMTVATIGKRSRPSLSYEATIADLSSWSRQAVDRFDIGDTVLIIDRELGIETTQRIVAIEYDILQPWRSRVTLSEKLRSLGSDTSSAVEAGMLDTGASIDTRDLVPFNLLKNGRFDNGLAHWASSGAVVIDGGVTGPRAVELAGSGVRWIEQTVATDTRDAYTLSLEVDSTGGPSGWVPDVRADIEIVYDDGTSEIIGLELS